MKKGEKRYKDSPILLNEKQIFLGESFLDISQNIIPGIYDYYQISNMGRVYHKYMGDFIKQGICGSGYYFFSVSTLYGTKLVRTHRIEMMVFNPIPNMELFDVNHKDGNKLRNVLWNLEWMSHSDNMIHAYNNGLHKRTTNLSTDTVIKVCNLLQENKYTNLQIANIVSNGVTESIVSSIKQRESWREISKDYTFYRRSGKLLSDNDVQRICVLFEKYPKDSKISINKYCKMILYKLGYDLSDNIIDTTRKIYTRKYYTNISHKYKF